MNKLYIDLASSSLLQRYTDGLEFLLQNSYEVARCLRGRTVNGQPDYLVNEPLPLTLATAANPQPTTLWCDWTGMAFSDGGAPDAATPGAPDAGTSLDGGISLPASAPRIHLTPYTDIRSSLWLFKTCPDGTDVGAGIDGWIQFQSFGSAEQTEFPRPRPGTIPDDSWFRIERNLLLGRHVGMNAVVNGSCLVGMAIFVAFSGRPARAAEGPLLVVVEAPPALDADAAEIRRTIGVELRAQTIAPMKRGVEPPERALIVAFDRDRIAMSLRTNDGIPVVRDIPTPTDRAARLRAIAWLAGNLARDQVSPILAEAPAEATPLATIPSIAPAPTTEPPPPPSSTATATAVVPDAPVTPTAAETVTATERIAPTENLNGRHYWSITFADGPTAAIAKDPGGRRIDGTAWHLDVQRRSEKKGLLLGAALSGTNGNFAPEAVGMLVFVGSASRRGRWSFEATVGAGLELGTEAVTSVTATHSSANGFETTATQADAIRPGLLADAGVAVAHPLWQSLDAIVRLGAHLSTISLDDWFLTTTLGLRYNLQ
jgi:hypothetical protein